MWKQTSPVATMSKTEYHELFPMSLDKLPRALFPPTNLRDCEVRPDIYSVQHGKAVASYGEFLKDVVDQLKRQGLDTPVFDENGILDAPFVNRSADRLLTIPGFPSTPRPMAQVNLEPEWTYSTRWSSAQIERTRELFREFFKNASTASLHYLHSASTSAPNWSHDWIKKKEIIYGFLNDPARYFRKLRFNSAMDWFKEGRPFIATPVSRLQPEGSKPRRAMTLVDGVFQEVPVNKDTGLESLSAMRERLALAVAGWHNYVGTMAFRPYQSAWLALYAKTFAITRPADLDECFKHSYVVGMDMSNFDWQMAKQRGGFVAIMHEEWERKFGPDMGLYERMIYHVPIVGSWPWHREQGPAVVQNYLLDLEACQSVDTGWLSGIFQNTLAKLFAVCAVLVILHHLFPEEQFWSKDVFWSFVKGEHPRIRMIAYTDDTMLMCRYEADRDKLKQYLSTDQAATAWFAEYGLEEAFSMLSIVATRQRGEISCHLSASSYLTNLLVPEHSYNAHSRFWSMGQNQRNSLFLETAPDIVFRLKEIYESSLIRNFGIEPLIRQPIDAIAESRQLEKEARILPALMQRYQYAMIKFLGDPNSLYYNDAVMQAAEVDPNMRDLVRRSSLNVPFEHIQQACPEWFEGTTLYTPTELDNIKHILIEERSKMQWQ